MRAGIEIEWRAIEVRGDQLSIDENTNVEHVLVVYLARMTSEGMALLTASSQSPQSARTTAGHSSREQTRTASRASRSLPRAGNRGRFVLKRPAFGSEPPCAQVGVCAGEERASSATIPTSRVTPPSA